MSDSQILRADREAKPLERLLPRVYDELRQIAHARLRQQRPGETLNTTALVHEAYLRLAGGEASEWTSRAHFFALAARAMRFVLVDYARQRSAIKRGGPGADIPLDEVLDLTGVDTDASNLLSVDRALTQLGARSERLAEVVELRFFGGLEHAEIAEMTGRSEPTVKRDWRRARAWLYDAMTDSETPLRTTPNDPPAHHPTKER